MPKYDPTIKRILQQVADEEDLDLQVVEDIYRFIWSNVRTYMQDISCPRIYLANFGRFYVPVNKINKKFASFFKRYRTGRISREAIVSFIKKYWQVRKRLMLESMSRKHKKSLRKSTRLMFNTTEEKRTGMDLKSLQKYIPDTEDDTPLSNNIDHE